jgi:hypothetical protein
MAFYIINCRYTFAKCCKPKTPTKIGENSQSVGSKGNADTFAAPAIEILNKSTARKNSIFFMIKVVPYLVRLVSIILGMTIKRCC